MYRPYAILICILLLPAMLKATGTYYMTKDVAIKQYFPDNTIERKSEYLNAEQKNAIKQAARAPWEHSVVTYYVAKNGNQVVGYAFFESVTVRTKTATYMVVMNPNCTIRGIEILAFYEPEDYKPSRRWLDQFNGKSISGDLTLKSGIHNIVGSTLSAQALSEGARKYLGFCKVILGK
jgi:hypothetical protein